jgi:hypothetical protein
MISDIRNNRIINEDLGEYVAGADGDESEETVMSTEDDLDELLKIKLGKL